MQDHINAFVEEIIIEPLSDGILKGINFAAKDLFDIEGYITGYGNPSWLNSHLPAKQHSEAVKILLSNGATFIGKSHTDELAYSLMGVNSHYGTPINVNAPDRLPGGSSSGSAAATAAGIIDVGIGSDTGGSVRLPASFCGIWGIRTTHGVLSLSGACALAPSFDTLGWFAQTSDIMLKTAKAYGLKKQFKTPPKLILPLDLWALADKDVEMALSSSVELLEEQYATAERVKLSPDKIMTEWRTCFQTCQAYEAWACHGDWITREQPVFGPGIKERFEIASKISKEDADLARNQRQVFSQNIENLLGETGILVVPTSPSPAPKRDASPQELDHVRTRALEMLCVAGLAGLPQLSIPASDIEGAPIGLSLIGPKGSDVDLISIAHKCFGDC